MQLRGLCHARMPTAVRIEQHQIKRRHIASCEMFGLRMAGDNHAMRLERERDELPNLGVVIDNQHPPRRFLR